MPGRAQLLPWRLTLGLLVVLIGATPLFAQTSTGTLTGRVTDTAGLPVAGVNITIESPALQGTRTTLTAENGDYILPLLPPGRYTITFSRGALTTVREARDVAPTERVTLNAAMAPAAVTETVSVTAPTDQFTRTVQSATNFRQSLMDVLPTARTMVAAASLSPAVKATGPGNNLTISGAMSFENLYLLNGVPIQDNIRRTPLTPFIEDAIQETTIASSGISAEYGRFTGGVIQAITRSGGNVPSASMRMTFNNDKWRTSTPFGEPTIDQTVPTYEATAGGAIVQDRLWYFGAVRSVDRKTANETAFTRQAYTNQLTERRAEIKLTQAIGAGHRLQGSYLTLASREVNRAFQSPAAILDLDSLYTRETPQSLASVNYSGVFGSRLFVESQISQRTLQFNGDGGTSRDRIDGTVLLDQSTGARWWAPALCGVCEPRQQRNSDALYAKASYFLSTGSGAHTLSFGYDTFNDKLEGNNHQAGSDFQIWTPGTVIENGQVYPVLSDEFNTFILWFPIERASKGTDFRTHSLFFNDAWQANSHWSFNLGLRFDRNRGRDSDGQLIARDSAWSPRLGVTFDPDGDGTWALHGSFGQYVAPIATSIGLSASPAGIPGVLGYFYQGPPINAVPGEPLVPTRAALEQLFAWFDANGGTDAQPFLADLPGVATRFGGSLDSPATREVAGGISRRLGRRGVIRADVVHRRFTNFYAERVDATTGQVEARGQRFDVKLIENTDAADRQYAAMSVQAQSTMTSRLQLGANYTLSRLWGNVNGENAASGPLTTGIASYPEFFDAAWSAPSGDLRADQRHRARIWMTLSTPATRGGQLTLGVIEHAESGSPYGAVGQVRTAAFVTDPGYATPPSSVDYFFTSRDAFRTQAMMRTDLSATYTLSLPGRSRAEFFAQAQLLNAFNQFQVFNLSADAINTSVLTAVNAPDRFQPFDPFTETPVRGVHWDVGPNFGQPISARAYTLPRTFQLALGLRF